MSVRRTTLSRLAFALVSIVGVAGCPGKLEDRAQFEELPACPGNVDVEALFAEKCGSAICHGGQSAEPASNLDLTSPGVAHRLVGVASQQCEGLMRVDPENPDNSFLLGKLIEPPAGCGDRMPLVGILSRNEIACIRAWIHGIASTPVVDGGIDAGSDSGVDAAVVDSGIDAGPHDAGQDSGESDAGSDAGDDDAGSDAGDEDGGP